MCRSPGKHNSLLDEQGRRVHANGSIEEAVSAYDEALRLEPKNETILIHKASDLNILDRVNESREAYGKALGQGYNASMSLYVAQELGYEDEHD